MKNIAIFGAGRIGITVTTLLLTTKKYQINLISNHITKNLIEKFKSSKNINFIECNIMDSKTLMAKLHNIPLDAAISCLPYFANLIIAKLAKQLNVHYFDLTEDVHTAQEVEKISKGTKKVLIPQCGLAPGFVDIVANAIAQEFSELDTIKLRVGALPVAPSNALKYALTWSTDGLINEYCNPCQAIVNGKITTLQPLEGLEQLTIDGLTYECFNTSGGIGTLVNTYQNKVKNLNYKTIRYPEHCKIMRFLMNDLKLNQQRKTLKNILEDAIPETQNDVVLIVISVTGKTDGKLYEKNYVKKIYGATIENNYFTAIQITTAASLCCIVDKVLKTPDRYAGFYRQEDFSLQDIIGSDFGSYFK